MESLSEKLSKIRNVFNIDQVLTVSPTKAYIKKYYKVNQFAYSLFHTMSDRIYMGVSRDGIYNSEDLLEAARTVESHILLLKARNVLELATGRGANSAYLVEKYPQTKFNGIDLSEGQLHFARKRAKVYENYEPILGDYHDLSAFADNSQDICFVVEALCYSTDKQLVLSEVHRVLKQGGIFIIFDGYLHKSMDLLTSDELKAARLTEIGMAVEKFEEYIHFKDTINKQGWKIVKEENVSQFVLPTMRRFEKLARRFFKHPRIAKLVTRIFRKEFTYNAISGYLMPTLIENGVANYMITILQK